MKCLKDPLVHGPVGPERRGYLEATLWSTAVWYRSNCLEPATGYHSSQAGWPAPPPRFARTLLPHFAKASNQPRVSPEPSQITLRTVPFSESAWGGPSKNGIIRKVISFGFSDHRPLNLRSGSVPREGGSGVCLESEMDTRGTCVIASKPPCLSFVNAICWVGALTSSGFRFPQKRCKAFGKRSKCEGVVPRIQRRVCLGPYGLKVLISASGPILPCATESLLLVTAAEARFRYDRLHSAF